MGEKLIKPYEISVWEDELITSEGTNYYKENKLAVIGSDTMTGLSQIYEPVFTKNINGEKTLTFSLRYKYFEPYIGVDGFVNPFAALLINERKVKLHYDNHWYDFIIKDHTESSDGLVWTYTCTDAFVQELSKTGYNLEFSSDLNNNQGTASELATKVLDGTDWRIGSVDTFKQLVEDPIYKAVLKSKTGIDIINASGDGTAIPAVNSDIYVFYSYVANNDGKFVQFIIRDKNRKYNIDDKNVINDTNFRITTPLTYDAAAKAFKQGTTTIIQINTNETTNELDIDTQYHAYRLAYNQLTTYDPILERTVQRYSVTGRDTEVYNYTDYEYTTSDVLTNFISNGDNFSVVDDGEAGVVPQGWSGYTRHTGSEPTVIKTASRPELDSTQPLALLNNFGEIESFLAIDFNGPLDNEYRNTVFNSGIEDNAGMIGSIQSGDEFLFRWRGGSAIEHGAITDNAVLSIRMIVAKYTTEQPSGKNYYLYSIDKNNIILNFEGSPQIADSYIDGGNLVTLYRLTKDTTIVSGKTYYTRSGTEPNYTYTAVASPVANQLSNYYVRYFHYAIDGVTQEPSTKYIYRVKDGSTIYQYKWDPNNASFVSITESNPFRHYYYLTATAEKTITEEELQNPETNIGIFIYSNYSGTATGGSFFFLQDVQLTRYYTYEKDGVTLPVLLGNVPEAQTVETTYYYERPKENANPATVPKFTTIAALASKMGVSANNINPKYNEDSEKILSISESQSNCFNILQSIAETFECWVEIDVKHKANGEIDRDGRGFKKYINLRNFVGKDNWAGFKYAVNISSIEREVNSEEIVTKLIVDQSQSDYTETGYVSIQDAKSNPSGESYILNFDYFLKQGLVGNTEQTEKCRADINNFNSSFKNYNNELKTLEAERRRLENSLVHLESQRNVFSEMIKTAKENVNKKLLEFKKLTGGISYEQYQAKHTTIAEIDDKLTEEGTIVEIIGELYSNSSVINNYSGILTNLEKEYQETKEKLSGLDSYYITVQVNRDANNARHVVVTVSDYPVGLKFTIGSNGSPHTVTVSNNTFNEITNATTITFNAIPTGYTINVTGTQNIIDAEITTYELIPLKTIDSIEAKIKRIQIAKDNLTKEFNKKYSRFIQEGTWNSTDYIDAELYYLDALQVSNTSAQPVVSYTINVVEISEIEDFKDYKFDVGDKTYIQDTEFFGWATVNGVRTPAQEEVIVSIVEWHLDDPANNVITVQNYKTRFEDLFQRISAAVQTVQYNEATYAKITTLLDENGTINQDLLLDAMNNLAGKERALTSDGSITIHGDEILIQNLQIPTDRVILNSRGIRISSDGGKSWATAIDGKGINIGTVYTGMLNTNSVIIGDREHPSFRWDRSGISAYKYDETEEAYDLNTFVRYDQYGLYGIKKNSTFLAHSVEDVKDKAHFAVTWDGFFIKNSYEDGGRVSITSDNDFQVIDGNEVERVKIGSLGINPTTNERIYGINISNQNGDSVLSTNNNGDLTISGTIYANAGEIGGMSVDNTRLRMDHIVFEPGTGIYSDWGESSVYPFIISDKDGGATFNNVVVRGSIKTSVFEYEEIQAVGGAFMFRPSTAIKTAVENSGDLILTVEKPLILRDGAWYKLSNYNSDDTIDADELTTYGLTHIYQLNKTEVDDETEIRLIGGAAILQTINIDDIPGGSIIDMGFEPNTYRPMKLIEESSPVALHLYELVNGEYVLTSDVTVIPDKTYYKEWYQAGINNYGIGINSSDNYINLPPRAISLFETIVNHNQDPKVSYKYRGILGTLPQMRYSGNNPQVSELYHNHMEGTQGIYTDNMYIGNKAHYIAFYTDKSNNNKKLRIAGADIVFTYDDGQGGATEKTLDERIEEIEVGTGEDAAILTIDSSEGNIFRDNQGETDLTVTIFYGASVITNKTQLTQSFGIGAYLEWEYKNNTNSWITLLSSDPRIDDNGFTIHLNAANVYNKANFRCKLVV